MTDRFVYRPDGPFGPDVIDRNTGRWMSLDLAREYAAVVNAALDPRAPSEPTVADAPITAEVTLDFAQVGTAGPFPVVNERVAVPEAAMLDLARMLRPTADALDEPPTVEPKGPPSEGLAHFHYRLEAASGYMQVGTYHDITAEKFGNLIGLLEGKLTVADAAQPAPAALEQAPAPVSAFAAPDDVTLLKAYSRAAHGRHLAPQDRATFLRYARIGIAADRARTSGSGKEGGAA